MGFPVSAQRDDSACRGSANGSAGSEADRATAAPVTLKLTEPRSWQAQPGANDAEADDWAGFPLLCRLPPVAEADAFGDQNAGILVREASEDAIRDESEAFSW